MGRRSEGKIPHKQTVVDGIKFHSKMESEFYELLRDEKSCGNIKDFEMQVSFLLQDEFIIVDGVAHVGGTKEYKAGRKIKVKNNASIKYIADFVITNNDDTKIVVDTKGVSTADFEIKKKMFDLRYPEYNGLKVICKRGKEWVDFYVVRKEKNAKKRAKAKAKVSK